MSDSVIINIDNDKVFVNFDDGHLGKYLARSLRLNCACAECIEEWTGKPLLNPFTVDSNIVVEDYLLVGKYAVQFLWSDGHFTGIFPFEVLRKLCECEICKPE